MSTTYTQEQMDQALTAERQRMATLFSANILNPLHRMSKLMMVLEDGVTELGIDDMGEVLQLIAIGGHVQALRIANKEDITMESPPLCDYGIEDTFTLWNNNKNSTRKEFRIPTDREVDEYIDKKREALKVV